MIVRVVVGKFSWCGGEMRWLYVVRMLEWPSELNLFEMFLR